MLWYRVLALRVSHVLFLAFSQKAENHQAVYPALRSSSRYFASRDKQAHLAWEVYRETDWEVVAQQIVQTRPVK